jgi:adenosine deaminase
VALGHKDRILGVGLDSDEKDNPPTKFLDVFARARGEGFRLTMHCDVDQQDSVRNIRQCLDDVGVERIDHGVNCLEDRALLDEIRRRGLGLTVCPISNSYVAGSLKADEIAQLLDLGLLVSIHSDDPAYFPGYIEENLVAVQEAADLSREAIVTLVGNAFEASWLDEADKSEYLAALQTTALG